MVEFIERMGMKKVEGREKMTFGDRSCGREEREIQREKEEEVEEKFHLSKGQGSACPAHGPEAGLTHSTRSSKGRARCA